MAAYLLSTQSLLDRLSGIKTFAIFNWLNQRATADTELFVSVVSIGYARQSVDAMDDAMDRTKYGRKLDNFVSSLSRHALLPVDSSIADTWAKILGTASWPEKYEDGRKGSNIVRLSEGDMLVVATALANELVLIEPDQPYHTALRSYGLNVENLGE